MLPPDEHSVLGDFNQTVFASEGITATFSKRHSNYIITLQDKGQTREYAVHYTFGFYPLQQYLLDIGNGKLQAFDIAWDSRPRDQGGQRWFYPNSNHSNDPASEFHWTRHLNNWNSRCAECHSTGLDKNYDPASGQYQTRYQEVNVACEACHGPAAEHVRMAQAGQLQSKPRAGLTTHFAPPLSFQFKQNAGIARAPSRTTAKTQQAQQINACGGCHSRRQIIGEPDPARPYHDQYRLTLLHDPLYFADGQIRDEVFVLGSFMQSKMHQQGVTCTHCHDAHSGDIKIQGNGLCSQCHAGSVYDTATHHQHKADSAGSLCINCHMPATTYMGIDPRRDHSFSIPAQPQTDAPNACQQCHQEPALTGPNPATEFGILNSRARKSDALALRAMSDYINNREHPSIRRATLLDLASALPARLTVETLAQQLQSGDALMRRAAVDASQVLPLDMRWTVLSRHINDASADVRFSIARQLAPALPHLASSDALVLQTLLDEHRAQLAHSNDLPGGLASLAAIELHTGNSNNAITTLEQALAIAPDYLPALLNLAAIYRSLDNNEQEHHYLKQALSAHQDNAAAQHAYGLFLIRDNQKAQAIRHLRRATEAEPSQARYFYVYAVALDAADQTSAAIDTLQVANQRWPNHYDILMALVQYLEKSQRKAESWPYLSQLSAIAPNDPAVRQRIDQLKQQE